MAKREKPVIEGRVEDMDNAALKQFADKLTENIEKVIVGKKEIIVQLLISLICGGHVLLEDVRAQGDPLAKTLSQSLAYSSAGCNSRPTCFLPISPESILQSEAG